MAILAAAASLVAGAALAGDDAPPTPRQLAFPKRRSIVPVRPLPTLGQRVARIAAKAVGVPYRWGGASLGGFDCSGLVYWAYRHVGIELPHSSYALYSEGRRVPRAHLEPGDVLFFSGLGHVGLYLGGGRMVHAPYSGRLVEVVRLGRSHYGRRLVGARRIARA